MSASFFFYDLETSGINPRQSRIMQFAGQRTDMQLNPIGDPVNLHIKMTRDILPDPEAVLLTGITPQQTLAEGITEAEFLRYFTDEIATENTIFLGFNTIRFDDEFLRYLHYRNFWDAYEWHWQDGRGRWDMLDVVRMTRALRPGGIQWPFDAKGRPTNRLELLTGLNKLSHEHAHDALSDVYATIEVAKLVKQSQPRLFDFLFTMRDKYKVADLVESNQPFVYTSGQYSGDFEKTTVAVRVCANTKKQGSYVFDLRYDPAPFMVMTPEQLAKKWQWQKERDPNDPRLPVKTIAYNKCPAVAPLSVLDEAASKRLKVDKMSVQKHAATLASDTSFADRLVKAAEILEKQTQSSLFANEQHVDAQLYDGFFEGRDKQMLRAVRAAKPEELNEEAFHFSDQRLRALLPLYKARNFPKTLTPEEQETWQAFCKQQLLGGGEHSRMANYMRLLQTIAQRDTLTDHQQYLLQELQLYAESIMPDDV
ncbi:MAG TPA: exodeoxyribonuclease I [Candidatus Saccharimonadales bacterium]|nr:exodeoxyribonuclease I [Candidatus Saccharimonadales bacterium]